MQRMILSGNIILNDKKEIYMLFRDGFLETPGGKLEESECEDFSNPSIPELMNASKRELFEEVKGIKKIISEEYLDCYEFVTPKGVKAIAHKTIRFVKGNLIPNEDIFDKEKSRFYSIKELEKLKVTPDFPYFLKIVKNKFLV